MKRKCIQRFELLFALALATIVIACSRRLVSKATIEALGYGDWDVRQTVAKEIAAIGPDAVPTLLHALEQEDNRVRQGIIWTLGYIGPEADVLPALLGTLSDDNREVRAAIVPIFRSAPAVDGSRPGVFYARAVGSETKFSMPTLAYHEAVPGHHFQ